MKEKKKQKTKNKPKQKTNQNKSHPPEAGRQPPAPGRAWRGPGQCGESGHLALTPGGQAALRPPQQYNTHKDERANQKLALNFRENVETAMISAI